jgi:hypothetical protein
VRQSLFYGVQPVARKIAHRFAESGYESGYIFELGFVLANNPSILGFFAFQYTSAIEANGENRFTCQLCSAQTYRQTCTPAGIGSSRKCGVD